MHKVVDKRIERAIAVIHADNDRIHTIKELANVAFIGVTQFKRLFKLATGSTVGQYQTKIKMEKPKSLLLCTDVPITSIAHDLGYSNLSAFTRRFTQHFGLPPSHYQIRQYPD
jgi:AraC-like DNA-binding protein